MSLVSRSTTECGVPSRSSIYIIQHRATHNARRPWDVAVVVTIFLCWRITCRWSWLKIKYKEKVRQSENFAMLSTPSMYWSYRTSSGSFIVSQWKGALQTKVCGRFLIHMTARLQMRQIHRIRAISLISLPTFGPFQLYFAPGTKVLKSRTSLTMLRALWSNPRISWISPRRRATSGVSRIISPIALSL